MSDDSVPHTCDNAPICATRDEQFVADLVDWYGVYKRDLPWRKTKNPYHIWLSEVILQQTRVVQGLPYYQRFVEQYPDVYALANAQEEDVLRLWQGLGYYSRARNLHACARMIVDTFHGKFPDRYQDLLHLRGVGKYTAAAIASIAFRESVAVVDGNVFRVLARVYGLEEDISTPKGVKAFADLAQQLVPNKDPDLYNQAIMEFGALHCTPVNPQCSSCMFQDRCVAFQAGKEQMLPVKTKKVKIQKRYLNYVVIQHDGRVYMRRRPSKGIWAGLYEFYLLESEQRFKLTDHREDALVGLIREHELDTSSKPVLHKHLLTHRQLYVQFFQVHATQQFLKDARHLLVQADMSSFTLQQVHALPKPILIENFLQEKFYS